MFNLYLMTVSAAIFWSSMTYFKVIETGEIKLQKIKRMHHALIWERADKKHLQARIGELEHKIQALKAKHGYLAMKSGKLGARTPASQSFQTNYKADEKDYVQYELYQWSPEKMHAIASHEFDYKRFLKSAQYYRELIGRYPAYEQITDRTYFKAGVASYESRRHYDWSIEFLSAMLSKYPKSNLKRNAKLWLALSYFQTGQQKQFYNIVEEFRRKYRNTDEWKILSKHYENLTVYYGDSL